MPELTPRSAPQPEAPTVPQPATPRSVIYASGVSSLWVSRPVTLLLAVASGVALWASFPDVDAWPLAFAGVALLYAALRRDSGRAAGWNALVGLVAGLTFWLPHIWWARFATDTVPWLALSVLEALFLAVFGALWTWTRRLTVLWPPGHRDPSLRAVGRGLAHAGAFAVVFVAVEQWRSELPFGGFPWGRLAWAVVDAPTGRAAWLGGTTLVSMLVATAGVLLALAVGRTVTAVPARSRSWTGTGLALLATALVVFPWALPLPENPGGLAPVSDHRSQVVDAGTGTDETPGPVLYAGIVQGNVAEPGLGSFANRAEVLNNHLDGTYAIADADLGGVDVVLWPENGSDLDPQVAADVGAAVDAAAVAVAAPILVGAQEYPESGGRYNVSLLWEPGEGVTARYAKQHPAPFGEYMPLRNILRVLSDQVDRVTIDMIPGTEPAVVDVPRRDGDDVRLATIICFEVAYDEIVRDAVARGAQVLVVQTNNASFGYTAESTQQLAMTRMQAISTGRAAVQVSTVGVSGVVAPDGTVVARTGLFTADQLVAALPLRTSLTPAVRAGYWPGWVVGAGAAALVVAGLVSHVRDRRERRSARPAATDEVTA